MSKTKQVAFKPSDGYGDNLAGSVQADGKTVDVGARLRTGNGTIVVDAASPEANALAGFKGLEPTDVPQARKAEPKGSKEA